METIEEIKAEDDLFETAEKAHGSDLVNEEDKE